MKTEFLGDSGRGLGEIGDGDDHMVNSARDRVDGRADALGRGGLFGWAIGAATSNFDAMGLTEDDAHDVFGEIGVDSTVDGVLPAGSHDIPDPIGLNDGRIAVFFDTGDFVADIDTFGQNVQKLPIKLVDTLTQSQEFGRRIGG